MRLRVQGGGSSVVGLRSDALEDRSLRRRICMGSFESGFERLGLCRAVLLVGRGSCVFVCSWLSVSVCVCVW